jgi:DNA-binding transcriptional LysR family regulator
LSKPSSRQIDVFRMVMLLGSANRAAAALHISQPAVTQFLQQLEERSGLRLFARSKGKLLPTPEALALMDEVQRVYEGWEAIERKIEALQSHEDQLLRVGSLHAMASSVMPRAVAQFQRQYPRIRFQLEVASSRSLRDALFQGALDVAFLAEEADTSGLDSSVFYDLPAVCAMPGTHPLARKARLLPADLNEVALVVLSASDPAQRKLMAAMKASGVRPTISIETPYSATQCALVLAGAGVAVTNPLVAREYQALGLHGVPLDAPVSFRALLAFSPRQAQSRAVQEFVALCRRLLEPSHRHRPRREPGAAAHLA